MSDSAFPWHFGAKTKSCATQHLLSSTSPSPSPFPFPILELKISRFRIFKRTLGIEFVPAIFNKLKKKGEEEVGEFVFKNNIHIQYL